MSYQLPQLNDDVQFEELVRDILRRDYDDPTIELLGRTGQRQHGVDGVSTESAIEGGLSPERKKPGRRVEFDLATVYRKGFARRCAFDEFGHFTLPNKNAAAFLC